MIGRILKKLHQEDNAKKQISNESWSVGNILREMRIRQELTLRQFCLKHNLDAIRFSLIERDELRPNWNEIEEYFKLYEPCPGRINVIDK